MSAKLALVEVAQRKEIPIISSMGTGNKLDPSRFEVADIYETSVCPLCRVMRRELKKRRVSSLKVVYSREEPVPREENPDLQEDFPSQADAWERGVCPAGCGVPFSSGGRQRFDGRTPAIAPAGPVRERDC